jgi:chitin synthase
MSSTVVFYEWNDVSDPARNLIVFNGQVLQMSNYVQSNVAFLGDDVHKLILNNLGRDVTRQFSHNNDRKAKMQCLLQRYAAGFVSKETPGCFTAFVMNLSLLVIIIGLILTRFIMAMIFSWCVAPRLGRPPEGVPYLPPGVELSRKKPTFGAVSKRASFSMGNQDYAKQDLRSYRMSVFSNSDDALTGSDVKVERVEPTSQDLYATYVTLLVTCYSEDEEGIRTTLESLACTDYPDRHKLIFMVADGLVKGGGNDRTTPEICISMLNLYSWSRDPQPMSYVAIADGRKQHNMAKVVSLQPDIE